MGTASMTAEMIEWTLILLEWIRERIPEDWPEAKLRGSSAELDADGYSIRFREGEEEYWMVITPEAILGVPVERATELLSEKGWIGRMKQTGCLHLGVKKGEKGEPELHPCPYTA